MGGGERKEESCAKENMRSALCDENGGEKQRYHFLVVFRGGFKEKRVQNQRRRGEGVSVGYADHPLSTALFSDPL